MTDTRSADEIPGGPDHDATEPAPPPPEDVGARSILADPKRWQPIGRAWLTEPPPPRRYLLDYVPKDHNGQTTGDRAGLLPAGRVGFLVGAGAAGKSYAFCNLALAVATGRDAFAAKDHPSPIEIGNVGPGPVALLMAEEEAEEMQRRLFYTARLMGLKGDDLELAARRVVAVPLAGEHVSLVYQATYGESSELLSQVGEDLKRALREHIPQGEDGWRLVALDPLSRFAGADSEKDNSAATRFVEVLERLTRAPGNPTVLVSHHNSQAARRDGIGGESGARGVTGLTDGARWIADLVSNPKLDDYNGPSLCKLDFRKSNYGATAAPVWLARDRGHHGALRTASPAEVRSANEAVDAQVKNAKSKTNNGKTKKDTHGAKAKDEIDFDRAVLDD